MYPAYSGTFGCRVVDTQSCNMHACLMHLYAHLCFERLTVAPPHPCFTQTCTLPLAVSPSPFPFPPRTNSTTSCRALPEDQVAAMLAQGLVDAGLLSSATSPFAAAVAGLMKGSCDLVGDGVAQLPPLLGYPLEETVASEEFKAVSGGWCGAWTGCGWWWWWLEMDDAGGAACCFQPGAPVCAAVCTAWCTHTPHLPVLVLPVPPAACTALSDVCCIHTYVCLALLNEISSNLLPALHHRSRRTTSWRWWMPCWRHTTAAPWQQQWRRAQQPSRSGSTASARRRSARASDCSCLCAWRSR
jgi:hypothetical protein